MRCHRTLGVAHFFMRHSRASRRPLLPWRAGLHGRRYTAGDATLNHGSLTGLAFRRLRDGRSILAVSSAEIVRPIHFDAAESMRCVPRKRRLRLRIIERVRRLDSRMF